MGREVKDQMGILGMTSGVGRARFERALLFGSFVAAILIPLRADAQRYIQTPDKDHPRLKYADSLESLNDRCIVRKAKLNPKMRPVYVNGKPVGFC